MTQRMDFAKGKYSVINDSGMLTSLRYGEPWQRDLTGDNLVYWMLVEALELKQQRDDLLIALKELRDSLDPDDWMGEMTMHEFIDSVLAKVSGETK